ncbi:hypothetical protein KUCAC02_017154 [Chaenocephalus aceratus]|uniref:Uncharacterized protein n=1 Tax=Chaenocephalus aceratus TaxID=36190 RepID=A0ACB9W0Z3_CHAAC|nr:hypothetical protein KUCAC02_017154 [Chaenocephalus aceratus]
MPPHGMPPHGMPPHGMPPHGMPPHGMPPHGMPPHGVPPHGVPPHGMPPHGVPPHGVPMERSSPVRQSFRKEEVSGTKPRNNMGSPVVSDIQGHLQGPIPPANEHHTRVRMKAMEQQIASLTGLVQHALLKEPNTSGSKELLSERPSKTSSPAHSAHSSGGSPVLAPKSASPSNRSPVPIKVNLLQFRKNVSDLRMQLHQMRQQQLQNQEALRVQLRRAEQEISVKLAEAMRGLEDPVQRQRALVEEDRHKYLGLEERVLSQLGDLEQYVGSLQNDSAAAAAAQRVVTMKDVEEGAVTLRKVGESLAGLKGEFPSLQTRMRSVLRVEVDAVKFLKEEPHKLDSMLKRVKSLTDTLGGLRRCASEGSQKGPSPSPSVPVEASPSAAAPAEPLEPQSSTIKSEVMPSSPVIIHHVQSSPVLIQQSQQSAALTAQPSPPLTPSPSHTPSPIPGKSQGRESPKGAASDPPSPARLKKTRGNPVNNGNGPTSPGFVIEELQNSQGKNKSRAVSIEAAEKEWEERRQNMGHYDGKEFEKILLEAQANMMKGIPSLEMEESPALPPAAAAEPADTPNPVESPAEELQPQPQPDRLEKKAPEKLPKPLMEKPGKPALETPPKTPAKPASPDSFTTKQGGERTSKSPPPPPPPRKTFSPSSSSGMTTTRSGEVVYTSRRDSVSAQEGEEDTPPPSPQPKPNKVAPETKPKPATPPPVTVPTEEEDEGDKIMAELQQSSESTREDKDSDTDENGNTTLRQSQGVIYYVTGQIPKEHPTPSGTEEIHEHRETAQPPSQAHSEDPPKANYVDFNEEDSLSPDLPGEEAPPPPDNIAFMITNTKVQALSCGEYQDLVNAKKGSVQTVTVGSAHNRGNASMDPNFQHDNRYNKKPVIIIFDEPIDIRSAYKRLSVIFEGEEELDRMLAAECIEEESEESDSEKGSGRQAKAGGSEVVDGKDVGASQLNADHVSLSSSSSSISEPADSGVNSNDDAKTDGKKKFKFKFPKKQLAAFTQAIRTGTKSGKKTLQVVVYEDEEESDGTIKQHKEAKRFEITRSKSLAEAHKGAVLKRQNSESLFRTDEIRKNAYKTMDSLEQTIKQLETTISEMGPASPTEETNTGNGNISEGAGLKRSSSLPTSRGSGPKVPSKIILVKKTKPQLLPRPVVVPTTSTTTVPSESTVQQNTSVASPTSRMPVPLSAKSRQSPGTTDKAGKPQKLQDAQRQFRQANGSAKRVGGDHKTTSPTIPTSKIPAFYPSSPKGSPQSAPNSDATNPINPSSSSSATKSSILSSPLPRSGSQPSSHIPSLSNGSLKLPSQHTGKTLSFSSQNGRVHSSSSSSSFSSSSSSPSPLSPTPLGPGGKSIRTIHTPSFTSYRAHNGSSNGKSCIPTATAAKDAS